MDIGQALAKVFHERPVSRRSILKGSLVTGGGAIVAPFLLSRVINNGVEKLELKVAHALSAPKGRAIDYGDYDESVVEMPSREHKVYLEGVNRETYHKGAPIPIPTPTPPPEPEIYLPPNWNYSTLFSILHRVDTQKPIAALTIDDGWDTRIPMLDMLKEKDIKATLFVVGRIWRYDPEFCWRAYNDGHEFGNHTENHDEWLPDFSSEKIYYEIAQARKSLQSIIPEAEMKPYFRPPGGALDSRVVNIAAELGYRNILWDFDPGDWRNALGWNKDYIVQQSGPGAIIVMHFRQHTLTYLPGIIDAIRDNGIELGSLSKTLAS